MNLHKKVITGFSLILLLIMVLPMTSCKKNISVAGTFWAGVDSDGDYYIYRFFVGGRLGYTSPNGTYSGSSDTWTQTDTAIIMSVNGGYAIREGTINGNQMQGSAWNAVGHHWTWTAIKQGNL